MGKKFSSYRHWLSGDTLVKVESCSNKKIKNTCQSVCMIDLKNGTYLEHVDFYKSNGWCNLDLKIRLQEDQLKIDKDYCNYFG